MKQFATAEVAKHNTEKDCWIIVQGKVFDVTNFLSDHPGGKKILLKNAGTDATKQFEKFHNPTAIFAKYSDLQVGVVGEAAATIVTPVSPKIIDNEAERMFGEMVPFGDPSWYQGYFNPCYYNQSHIKFRRAVRAWVESEVMPNCAQWDEAKNTPRTLLQSAYKAGILPGVVHTTWPDVKYAGTNIAGGIKPEEFDAFHFIILFDEIARCGSGGVMWGLFEGIQIGLPPVLHWGLSALKEKVIGPCLKGEKSICLCITEPEAGSDVAGLKCTAKKSPCGKYYIVNGEKKWITGGMFADYFTVAVRTGGEGNGGVSLLLIERQAGVTTKQMNCMGMWGSGTAYVTFEDVKVPVENLIGKENEGFKYVMKNFNFERLGFCVQANRFARVCYEESFKYSFKRETFGKKLHDHQVIRFKLSEMIRQIESSWAQIESLAFQMKMMPEESAALMMGAPVALAKVQNTKVFEYCAREAAQIFGGLSYSRGGQGEKIERLYREVRAMAIPGGSEEILLDFGVKQQKRILEQKTKKLAKL